MTELDVTLIRPYWLMALPVLAVLLWWLTRRQGNIGDWSRAADPAMLEALAALGRIETASSRFGLYACIAAAGGIALALSGPAIERRDTLSFRNLDGVVFVLDASPSVTESDRWPQMLTMGRFGVAALGTRPGALVVFAGDAYVATDMTADLRQLGQTMSLITPETVPDPGTRPARGLALARTILENAQVLAGDVILMTDGAGLGSETLQEAGAIADRGARLSVISLEPISGDIETHVEVGQGRAFTLDQTDSLSAWLRQDARTRLEQQDYPLLFWQDVGRLLILFAMAPLLLLFRRQST